jgi:hypothetical protein
MIVAKKIKKYRKEKGRNILTYLFVHPSLHDCGQKGAVQV